MKTWPIALLATLTAATPLFAMEAPMAGPQAERPLSLIVDTPEEGFQLALRLARKGVTATQPDRSILFELREVYGRDADALIASSQVVAIHFQTVAAANDYWRDLATQPAP